MRVIQILLLLVGVATTIGCTTKVNLNSGEGNYRVARGGAGQLVEKYQPAALDGSGEMIAAEDSVTLILKQAFVHDFSERFERLLSAAQTTTVRGEIAIVATVFEMQDGRNLDFADVFAKKGGRLIYYSPDVRSGGHFLNFSTIPLYGPITYNGNPIAVKLVVVELDGAEAGKIQNILGTVARLGAQAFPPSSPVLATLDAIGTELLSGEQDDLEFQYSFYLYPTSGNTGAPLPALRTGDYVFIKADPLLVSLPGNPFKSVEWAKLCFDQSAGRLVKPKEDQPKANGLCHGDEFRDNTYMVVSVQSGLPSVGMDTAEAFAGFQAKIAEAAASEADLTVFNSSLDKVIADVKASLLEARKTDIRRRGVGRTIDLIKQVPGLPDGRERELAVLRLYDALLLRPGFPVDDKGAPEPFTDKEVRRLVEALRYSAKKPSEINAQHVTGPASAQDLSTLLVTALVPVLPSKPATP